MENNQINETNEINENDATVSETIDDASKKPKKTKFSFLSAILSRRKEPSEPVLIKGKTYQNLHSNYKRDRSFDKDPSYFPPKRTITTWQQDVATSYNEFKIDEELVKELEELANDKRQ